MAVRIKVNIDLKKKLKAAQSYASKQIKSEIVGEIQKNYDRGISPVKGYNQFIGYSDSVAKKKGRKKPVTIYQTGQLRGSLKAVQKSFNRIMLFFRGKRNQKIAGFINFGTKNMDARPLLPVARGQKFKKRITDKFEKIVSNALKRFVK